MNDKLLDIDKVRAELCSPGSFYRFYLNAKKDFKLGPEYPKGSYCMILRLKDKDRISEKEWREKMIEEEGDDWEEWVSKEPEDQYTGEYNLYLFEHIEEESYHVHPLAFTDLESVVDYVNNKLELDTDD